MARQSELLVLMLPTSRATAPVGSFVEKFLRVGLEGLAANVGTDVVYLAAECPFSRGSRTADHHAAYRVFVTSPYLDALHAKFPLWVWEQPPLITACFCRFPALLRGQRSGWPNNSQPLLGVAPRRLRMIQP